MKDKLSQTKKKIQTLLTVRQAQRPEDRDRCRSRSLGLQQVSGGTAVADANTRYPDLLRETNCTHVLG